MKKENDNADNANVLLIITLSIFILNVVAMGVFALKTKINFWELVNLEFYITLLFIIALLTVYILRITKNKTYKIITPAFLICLIIVFPLCDGQTIYLYRIATVIILAALGLKAFFHCSKSVESVQGSQKLNNNST